MLRAWKQTNPAPMRVKPIPITVIRRIAVSASTADVVDDTFRAAADMIVITFFFLLHPGEYTNNKKDPFRLANTQLFISKRRLPILTAPAAELCQARFASLTFTSQKKWCPWQGHRPCLFWRPLLMPCPGHNPPSVLPSITFGTSFNTLGERVQHP
jgi:hypothetical protein